MPAVKSCSAADSKAVQHTDQAISKLQDKPLDVVMQLFACHAAFCLMLQTCYVVIAPAIGFL